MSCRVCQFFERDPTADTDMGIASTTHAHTHTHSSLSSSIDTTSGGSGGHSSSAAAMTVCDSMPPPGSSGSESIPGVYTQGPYCLKCRASSGEGGGGSSSDGASSRAAAIIRKPVRVLEEILGVERGAGPHGRRRGEPGHEEEVYLQFLDFTRRLLIYDPQERWTPTMALQHPYLTSIPGGGGASGVESTTDVGHSSSSSQQQQTAAVAATSTAAPMSTEGEGDSSGAAAANVFPHHRRSKSVPIVAPTLGLKK